MRTLICLSLFFTLSSSAVEIAFERDDGLPLVYLSVAVRGGAVTDPRGFEGLTDFMGEMLLRGTKKKSKRQIDLTLDRLGSSIGVETRGEMMVFSGAVLSQNVEPFLELFYEILTEPKFVSSEIEKHRKKVFSQLKQSLGSDSYIAQRNFKKFLFRDHPYGNPVIGTRNSIRAITRKRLINHYQDLIRDNCFVIVGSGKVDPGVIHRWSHRLSKARPQQDPFKPVSFPLRDYSRRLLIVDKPGRTQSTIHIGHLGVKLTDPDFFPLKIANEIFGGGTESRLQHEIREKRGWSYGVFSFFRHGLRPNAWQMTFKPATQYTANAIAVSLKLLEDLQQKGVTRKEFEFAQNALINSSAFMRNTPRKRVHNRLFEKILNLPDGFMDQYVQKIRAVDFDQVNKAVKKFFRPEAVSIVVLGTADSIKEPIWKMNKINPDITTVRKYTESF